MYYYKFHVSSVIKSENVVILTYIVPITSQLTLRFHMHDIWQTTSIVRHSKKIYKMCFHMHNGDIRQNHTSKEGYKICIKLSNGYVSFEMSVEFDQNIIWIMYFTIVEFKERYFLILPNLCQQVRFKHNIMLEKGLFAFVTSLSLVIILDILSYMAEISLYIYIEMYSLLINVFRQWYLFVHRPQGSIGNLVSLMIKPHLDVLQHLIIISTSTWSSNENPLVITAILSWTY